MYWTGANVRARNIHATHFSQLNKGLKFLGEKNWPKLILKKLRAINKKPQEGGKREPISSSYRAGPAHIHDSVFVYFTQLQTIVLQSLCTRLSHSFCDVALCILIIVSVLEETAAFSSMWKKKSGLRFPSKLWYVSSSPRDDAYYITVLSVHSSQYCALS